MSLRQTLSQSEAEVRLLLRFEIKLLLQGPDLFRRCQTHVNRLTLLCLRSVPEGRALRSTGDPASALLTPRRARPPYRGRRSCELHPPPAGFGNRGRGTFPDQPYIALEPLPGQSGVDIDALGFVGRIGRFVGRIGKQIK